MPELTRRYVVMAMASEAPFDLADPDGVFVLKPWKDPAALRALRAYADHCYPALARDLTSWIEAIARGPVVRGDVGRRNESHAGEATKSRRAPKQARPVRPPRLARRPARKAKKRRA